MTREMIIEELKNQGYDAQPWDVTKNGTTLQGIRINDGHAAQPIIYTEKLIANAHRRELPVQKVAAAVIEIYEKNKAFNFDTAKLSDPKYILQHLFIGIQKNSQEDIVKKPIKELEGLESYLYLRDKNKDNVYSIRMTSKTLALSDVSPEEAWSYALKNVEKETTIESLRKVVCDITNHVYDEKKKEHTPLFIISNKTRTNGAAAILNKKVLAEFGEQHHVRKVIVLPSSVHEMLLIPCPKEYRLGYFSDIVKEVNDNEVPPAERLTDRAYVLSVSSRSKKAALQQS